MPSDPLLPFDTLLDPIPGEHPAGDTVPFSVREKLEEFRKEINPAEFSPDDPLRPAEPKRADWGAIVSLATQTLREASKDFLVTARLTEALTRLYGFAGARDGLKLFRLLVEQCWDRLHPEIEDGDVEVRATALNWLDDPDRGARFPNTVRAAPLVFLDGAAYGWLPWKQMQEGRGTLKPDEFDRAVQATPREQCQRNVEDIEAALKELDDLVAALSSRMGEHAPSLMAIKAALNDALTLARQILHRKGPAPIAAAPEEEPEAAAPAEGPASAAAAPALGHARPMRTRDDVYRQLAEAAGLLQQIEPHSPIPYLIQRAVALGALPFPRLMKELIRDANILAEMNRELGIKDEEGGAETEAHNEE